MPSRVLHGSEPWALAGRRGAPPPGQPESQLQPPGSWARQRGSRLSAKLCRVKTFQYLIYQSCRGLYY
jgi:hypothetical protein